MVKEQLVISWVFFERVFARSCNFNHTGTESRVKTMVFLLEIYLSQINHSVSNDGDIASIPN